MSDKLKPRKLAPNYAQDPKWRNKIKVNTSSKRYTREFMLEKYTKNSFFPIPVPEDILVLFEPENLPPLTAIQGFTHNLGDFVNSRKFNPREKKNDKAPEWLDDEQNQKISESKDNLVEDQSKVEDEEKSEFFTISPEKTDSKPILEQPVNTKLEVFEKKPENHEETEENTKTTETPDKTKVKKRKAKKNKKEAETKEKNEPKDPKESEVLQNPLISDTNPEKPIIEPVSEKKLIPAYEKSLLQQFVNKGNPFAKAMIQTGIESDDGKIYFPLNSKTYEKVWFYKDPESKVQGPFSCIEMLNWTVRKCFPENLEISFCNTEFVPMNNYLTNIRKTFSEKTISNPKSSQEEKTVADSPKKAWGTPDKPVAAKDF